MVFVMGIRVCTIFIGLLLTGATAIAVFIFVTRHPPLLQEGETAIPSVVVDGKSRFVCIGAGDGIGSSVQLFESIDAVRIEFSQFSLGKRQSADLRAKVLCDCLRITDRRYRHSSDGPEKGERIAGVFRDSRDPMKSYCRRLLDFGLWSRMHL
jgi:hypothetical protein